MGKLTRRVFLGLGVAAVGGLAVGAWYVRRPYANPLEAGLAPGDVTFNAFLKLDADGGIVVIAPRAEMGQGVGTTLAAMVAEELDVGLDQISMEHGPASSAYYNAAVLEEGAPYAGFDDGFMAEATRSVSAFGGRLLGMQVTGGSTSMIDGWEKMRLAGAVARERLKRAAAARWSLPAETLRTERAEVIAPAGERAGYAGLAAEAAALDGPDEVALRPASAWTLLGRSQPRMDLRAKVTGAPVFGIDVELPEMLHATVRMSPVFGARARRADTAAAEAVPGVLRVVPLSAPCGHGFGVIAANTWAAFRGAEALEVEWEAPDYPADDAAQFAALAEALDTRTGFEMGGAGDPAAAFAAAPADEVMEVEYRVPFLAHACMEPMNATARLSGGRLEIWTGTQAPTIVQQVCGPAVGLSSDDVDVHVASLGGGFGRRAEADFPLYAALLARETDGRPVKVTWSREEDTRHDVYRPAALGRFRAQVRPGEGPVAMEMRMAAPAVMASILGRTFPWLPAMGPDKPIVDGAFNQPCGVAHSRFEGVAVDLGVPVGFWRSVGNSINGFFHESLMDEIAVRAGVDPVAMRLRLMQGDDFAPARRVVERAAEMANWGAPPPGRAQGIAFALSFGTWVAQVAEVSGDADALRVERVWCAADLGRVLDPRNVEAQMTSGIVFGLSAAMGQAISFEGGAVRESNFHDFDALRLSQCPQIEVSLAQTAPRMGGAGEPGTPPAAPALGNAIFALTGRRLREMPFGRHVAFV